MMNTALCRLSKTAIARSVQPCKISKRQLTTRSSNSPKQAPCEEPSKREIYIQRGALLTVGSWLSVALEALAKDGEYGILEGTTLALIHPVVMVTLFGTTLYAGYLGWQWRRLREIGVEIRELKKKTPSPDADGNVPDSPIFAEITTLEEERKKLSTGGFRDRHWNVGSILLGGGIFTAVFGCVNTYTRTGKLFPGPHLFAGAGIVVLWAVAAALVPSMQKGNENARTAHIALNALNVLLFAWQLPTGFEIVGKVFEFTTFP